MNTTSHDDHLDFLRRNRFVGTAMRISFIFNGHDTITSPPRVVSLLSDFRHVRSLQNHCPRKNSAAYV